MTRTLSAVLVSVLIACNPYSPDLGVEPFKCGDSEPRCPLDYTCVTYAGGQAICELTDQSQLPDGGTPDADPNQVDCNDDADIEPNDVLPQAFDTGIPDLRTTFSLVGLAICPETDIDLFKFQAAASGGNVTASVTYAPNRGELSLDVVNAAGSAIATGAPSDADPNVIEVTITGIAAGTYYARIKSAAGGRNNYERIVITTTP